MVPSWHLHILLTYRECSQSKDSAQYYLSFQWEARLNQQRHWEENNHDIGGDVEDGVGNHVVRLGRAVHYKFSQPGLFRLGMAAFSQT